MRQHIISKAVKGQEFLYSKSFMMLCKNKKEADLIAQHLNENNEFTMGMFKLKEGETWHTYEIDDYDSVPQYKISQTKRGLIVKRY